MSMEVGTMDKEGYNGGKMNPGSGNESYLAFALSGLRKNPGEKLNQSAH